MIANDKPVSTRTATDVMVASFLTCKFACRSLAGRHRWDIIPRLAVRDLPAARCPIMHIFDLTRILRRGCRHEAGHGESVFVSVSIRLYINRYSASGAGQCGDRPKHNQPEGSVNHLRWATSAYISNY